MCCKNCAERHYLCHAECEWYKEYRKKRDEENERNRVGSYTYGGTEHIYRYYRHKLKERSKKRSK